MTRVLGHPDDATLGFLADHIVLYYAGVDDSSLPLGEGRLALARTANRHLLYLKALLLVADYVVVPPSFHFAWFGMLRDQVTPNALADLQHSAAVLSPIYLGMTSGTDFLDYKRSTANTDEREDIRRAWSVLQSFFRSLPVYQRDVGHQSGSFRTALREEFARLEMGAPARAALYGLIDGESQGIVRLSRAALHDTLAALAGKGALTRHKMRRAFYTVNRAYYRQGARTYGAAIAMPQAPRYAVLGATAFAQDGGILVAYDPEVVLGVLAAFGVEPRELDAMEVQEILRLRESPHWSDFKDTYRHLAVAIQDLHHAASRLARSHLDDIQRKFLARCIEQVNNEGAYYRRQLSRQEGGELVGGLLLGAATLTLSPVVGFCLSLLPAVLHFTGARGTAHIALADRLGSRHTMFWRFARDLREAADSAAAAHEVPRTGVAR